MKAKIVFLIIILVCLLFIFGCTSEKDDATAMFEFTKLKQDYRVTKNYSTSIVEMNDYIIDLSELSGKSSPVVSRVIETEIYSAQTFYHLLLAESYSNNIIFSDNCNESKIKSSKAYIDAELNAKLAVSKAEQAKNKFNSLLPNERMQLRENQLELIDGYGTEAESLLNNLREICLK